VAFCDPAGSVVHHLDVRYLARARAEAEPVVSEESVDVRWWRLDALPTEEPDMLEMIDLALSR
jgi:hypothetical protein